MDKMTTKQEIAAALEAMPVNSTATIAGCTVTRLPDVAPRTPHYRSGHAEWFGAWMTAECIMIAVGLLGEEV